jgi:hypothetical protein
MMFVTLCQTLFMKPFLFILFSLFTISSFAQKKKIWGYVLDSATKEPIELASIMNLNKGTISMSNSNGKFSIDISGNNLLAVASINHYFDTLMLTNQLLEQDTLIVYLKNITKNLQGVTVTSIGNRYAFDSAQRRRVFLQDVGGNKIPTFSTANSGAGLGISIDRFSKREKQKRKAFEMFDEMEQEQYINYRFPAQLVSKYTTLRGDSLINFMQQHRPEYKWLRKHTKEEDLEYYINEQLKIYFKRERK